MGFDMKSVEINFIGPFGWGADKEIRSIYDEATRPTTAKSGVYLWTVLTPDGDELVNYVGQTRRSFARRFEEHQVLQSTGSYHVYDPDRYVHGQKKLLWGGVYGYDKEPSADFESRFEELKPVATRFMEILRFHIAPVSFEQACAMSEDEFRSRLEAGLAYHFYHQEGVVGEFQEADVEYLKESTLPTQRLHRLHWPPPDATTRVICHAQCKIRGFPSEVIL